MQGKKTGIYIVSSNPEFQQVATKSCAGFADVITFDDTPDSALDRLRVQWTDQMVAPRLIMIDANVSGGVENAVAQFRQEHSWLYILVAGKNAGHETILDAMRAQADNFVELATITPKYLAQLMPDIESRSTRSELKTYQNYVGKRLSDIESSKERWAEIKAKFEEFGLPYDDWESRAGTVLVVDDEPDNRFLVSRFLKPHGYNILTAENGKVALQQLKDHPEIDVVVLDVRMPELSGDQALAEMKNMGCTAEVIMLTAFKDNEIVVNTFRADAFDYINKPLKADALVQKVALARQYKYSRVTETLDVPIAFRKNYLNAFLEAAKGAEKTVLNQDADVFVPELFAKTKANWDEWETLQKSPFQLQYLDSN